MVGLAEIWRPVVGFEGRYEVSNLGRVRRTFTSRGHRYGDLLRGVPQKSGHIQVQLTPSTSAKSRMMLLHHVVLEAFVGGCPVGYETRHLDGNPQNNVLSNLCWGTHVENMEDRERHGRTSRNERHATAKLSDMQVAEMRKRAGDGERGRALAREFGIGYSQAQRIISGQQRPIEVAR